MVDETLMDLGLDPRSAAAGYDHVLDDIYDQVASSIEGLADILERLTVD